MTPYSLLVALLVVALVCGMFIALRPARRLAAAPREEQQPAGETTLPRRIRTPRVNTTVTIVPAETVSATEAPAVATDEAATAAADDAPTDTAPPQGASRTGFVWNGGNIRRGPGLKHPVVGGVDAGDVVALVEKQGDWWHVKTDAVEGWVSATLLVVDGEQNPLAPSDGASGTSAAQAAQPAPTPAAHRPASDAEPQNQARPATPSPPQPTAAPARTPPSLKPAPRPAAAPSGASGGASLWNVPITPGHIVPLPGVAAPHPFLAPAAVQPFLRARTQVLLASGTDYLGRLDEAFRSIDFETRKAGVARRSWHKAGRAIDLATGYPSVVFVHDSAASRLSRVYIRCARQDGSLGTYYSAKQLRGRDGYYVDVTEILERQGFQRIPPNGGVSEAWHYELRGGISWAQAMQQLYIPRMLRRLYPEVWR